MAFFNNKRRDFSIQPPRQQVDSTPFFVTDSTNIDFTLENLNLTANLTTTGITAGNYGSATLIPILTLDQYGRVTGVSTTSFSASGISLETNGTPNPVQTLLNLVEGTNITITDDGLGNITFSATGGGGSGTVTSVAATVPTPTNPAFSVAVPNPNTTPSIDITANGNVSQYIRGDGSLANFSSSGGGGSSLNYYLNGSVSQGTLGGVAFRQMSSTPVIGAGTNFSISSDGYIQSFITDATVPNQLLIPAGNWLFEMYFNASSPGGSPRFYVEIYKLSGGTLSLIASSVANPEFITNGTAVDLYTTAVAVPSTALLAADRIAVRVYVIHSGRTITLHTEDSNLCEVITTFSTGITALNGLTAQIQNLTTGTSGTDFGITSATDTHTFNLPTASATNRGALSSADWSTFNGKFPTPTGTTSQYVRGDGSLATFPTVGVGTVTNVSASVPSPASPAFAVAVSNPTTTPAIAITANGTASQLVTGNGSLASIASISTVSSIFQEDVYISNTAPVGIEYVQSVGKLYVCNNTSGNVTIFDTTNGNLLATVVITAAARIKYIQSINEVWVSSGTLTTIARISPTTNLSLGTIAGVTAGGSDFLEYSATKVFLLIGAAAGSIIVINPTLLTIVTTITLNVPSFPGAMAYNSNVASLQFDKIVITAAAGVFILDPTTNLVSTTLANPSSVFSSGARILYSATDNKYYAASLVNNRVVVLSIATATTFTATFVGNNLFLNDIKIDDTNDLLFTFPLEGGVGQNVLVKIFKKSTMTQIIAFRSSCFGGAGSQAGNGAIDLLNKRIFLTGRNTASNGAVSVIRYL